MLLCQVVLTGVCKGCVISGSINRGVFTVCHVVLTGCGWGVLCQHGVNRV